MNGDFTMPNNQTRFDINDIVRVWLKENNYDGLYHTDGDCACSLDDLAPCGILELGCLAGYKTPSDNSEFDFFISPTKEG